MPCHNSRKDHAATVFRRHAGAAQLEDRLVERQEPRDVEFPRRIEFLLPPGLRAQQPVSADHLPLLAIPLLAVPPLAIDDEQVVAGFVEIVEVAPQAGHLVRGMGAHLLVEDAVAQRLGLLDLGLVVGQLDDQVAGVEGHRLAGGGHGLGNGPGRRPLGGDEAGAAQFGNARAHRLDQRAELRFEFFACHSYHAPASRMSFRAKP